jgi:hypothetical protein
MAATPLFFRRQAVRKLQRPNWAKTLLIRVIKGAEVSIGELWQAFQSLSREDQRELAYARRLIQKEQ